MYGCVFPTSMGGACITDAGNQKWFRMSWNGLAVFTSYPEYKREAREL
jgi:hypothetical protein